MPDYNLGTASGRIEVDGKGAVYGFKIAESAGRAFFGAIRDQINSVQTLGRRMAAVGAGGVAGFGVAVKAASSFEQQMSGVKAVAGASEEQFEKLRQKALDLGSDTVFSASEAGQALEELVKAGVSVEDVLNGAADATVALAAAGGTSLESAATIAANAMNAFGMTAKEVPEVADILAGVANKGAADVTSLGESLSQAGAVAHLAGLSLKDTAIALGELSDAGINGSDAGTSLKTMLNNLQPITDRQSEKFKELGLLTYDLTEANEALADAGLPVQDSIEGVQKTLSKYMEEMGKGAKGTAKNTKAVQDYMMQMGGLHNAFFDANGDVKSLAGIQDVLAKATKGQTKQQKLANLEILFGADSMRAAAVMSEEGRKGVEKYNQALSKTNAADVAKTRMDNLSGSVEALKGSMETAFITIGNILLPVIRKIVDGLTWLVNAFNNLPNGVKVAIGVLMGIVSAGLLVIGMMLAALPLILSFIGNFLLMRAIGTVTKGFRTFFAVLRAGQGVMAASKAAALASGGAMKTYGTRSLKAGKLMLTFGKMARAAWLMATGPIGLAIAAVAAIIAVGVLLYKKWQPFHDLVDKIAAVLREKLLAAWAKLKPAIKSVWDNIKKFGDFVKSTLLPVIQDVAEMLIGKLLKGWNGIKKAFSGLLGPLKGASDALQGAGDAGGGLLSKLKPVGDFIMKFASTYGKIFIGFWKTVGSIIIKYVMPALIKIVGFLAGEAINAIVNIVKGIIQAVKGIIKIFTGLVNFFTGLFTGNWSKMWEGIKQIFSGAFDLIIGLLKVWLNVGLLKAVGLAFGLLKGIIAGGWRFILGIFKSAGAGIWKIVKGAFKFVWTVIKAYVTMWWNLIRGAWKLIVRAFKAYLKFILGIVRSVFGGIKGFISRAISAVKDVIVKAWTFVGRTTRKAFEALFNAVKTVLGRLIDFVKKIPGRIIDGLGNMAKLLYKSGKDVIQGLIDGIKDMGNVAIDAAKDIAKGVAGAVVDFFKIGSPSKLFRDYGSWTFEGLANGIKDEKKRVARVATDAAKAAYVGVKTSVNPDDLRAMSSSMIARTPMANTPAPAPHITQRKAEAKGLRFVSGELSLKNGRAYISGIAKDVYEDNEHTYGVWEGMYS